MPAPRTFLRPLASAAAVAGLTLGGLLVAVPSAQALGAPDDLKANVRNSSTVVLSWKAVGKAQSYDVQVDNTSSFSSPEFTTGTQNTKAVATSTLVPGKNFWRIRATGNGKTSGWATSSFTVLPVTTPIPLAPADGQVLPQPQSPPLLQWSSSQGAVSYTIEVDGDSDLLGAKVYTARTTSFVVTDPLTIGDWYWRVTANKDAGLTSLPSAVTRFDIQALPAPQITYPANDVTQAIEDIVLDWTPVPGARNYDVQVALDDDFNNITYSFTNVLRHRALSPPTTLANDQFWWRVRAVDLAGQPTPWTASLNGFQRQWLEQPQPVYPTGDDQHRPSPYIQWTPVQHASYYELYTATNANMTSGLQPCVGSSARRTCPASAGRLRNRSRRQPVVARSGPWTSHTRGRPSGHLLGPAALQVDRHRHPLAGAIDDNAVVPGLKVVDRRQPARSTEAPACKDPVADPSDSFMCAGVPTTPVFSWDPVPGATSYHLDCRPGRELHHQ